jgi:hypothetical protein
MSPESLLARREVWKQRIREFDQGTASVADFCQRLGVSTVSFYQWRQRLKPALSVPAKASKPSVKSAPPRKPAASMKFLPVQLLGQQNVEVQFPCGARVLVPSHDHEAIRTVLGALVRDQGETRAC